MLKRNPVGHKLFTHICIHAKKKKEKRNCVLNARFFLFTNFSTYAKNQLKLHIKSCLQHTISIVSSHVCTDVVIGNKWFGYYYQP